MFAYMHAYVYMYAYVPCMHVNVYVCTHICACLCMHSLPVDKYEVFNVFRSMCYLYVHVSKT